MQDQPVTEFVAQNPVAVWAVGPFFAAVTGVAFKEVWFFFHNSVLIVLAVPGFTLVVLLPPERCMHLWEVDWNRSTAAPVGYVSMAPQLRTFSWGECLPISCVVVSSDIRHNCTTQVPPLISR